MKSFIQIFLIAALFSTTLYATDMKVMVYNVENLFDTVHDEGKNDWAFTPKGTPGKAEACAQMRNEYYKKSCQRSDWTPKKLNIKLKQIKKVLLAQNGKLPHVLIISEIENDNVIKKLADILGYDSLIVSRSRDKRGIDLAVLFHTTQNIQKLNMYQHALKGATFKNKPSRDILEVEFLIGGKHKLNIFVNHWPSLSNPNINRLIAAKVLRARISQILRKDSSRNILAVGDFNTIDSNYPHPFNSILLKDNLLFDLDTLYKKSRFGIEGNNTSSRDLRKGRPLGTYFYAKTMSWNLLDRVFLNKNLKDKKGLELKVRSYKIEATNFNTKTFFYDRRGQYNYGSSIVGVPLRYDFNAKSAEKAGFSDHFPVSFVLRF